MAQDDEAVRLMSGRVAGKVALITGAARFLASDESKFITAHEIAPDAGVTEF
jgi:hypothetical protein